VPKATAVFDADDSRLGAALARINAKMLALQSRIAKFAAAWIALRAVSHLVSSGFERMRGAFEVGDKLNDLSANTGVAVADLVVLQQEFANAGKSAEDIGPAFAKMAKSIHGDAAGDAIQKLGFDLDELKRKTPAEQFRALGAAINNVKDPSQRAAMAMEVFGRSGAELLSVFASNGFDDASQQLGSQAQILGRDAALFDDVSDKLSATGTKVRGFWVGVADQVAPVLKPLLDQFMQMDLAEWGQKAGQAVAFIVQAFADGKMGDILFTSAKIAFANAVNFLAGALMAVGQALWQLLVEAFKSAVTILEVVGTADFWIGMGTALIGIAQQFIAFLLDGVATMLDWLAKAPLVGKKIGKGADKLHEVASGMREAGKRNEEAAGDLLAPAVEKTSARMHEAFEEISKALSAGFEKGSGLIDTGDWQQHLDEVIGGVFARVQQVSEKSREEAKPRPITTGAYDEELDAKKKPSVSALQRIGGGGNASYSTGDPILREQQRQTRELTTQTSLLRDVKRAIENKPTASTAALTPVFG
jgi:hypothetical protein